MEQIELIRDWMLQFPLDYRKVMNNWCFLGTKSNARKFWTYPTKMIRAPYICFGVIMCKIYGEVDAMNLK